MDLPRIAVNHCLDHLRGRKSKNELDLEDLDTQALHTLDAHGDRCRTGRERDDFRGQHELQPRVGAERAGPAILLLRPHQLRAWRQPDVERRPEHLRAGAREQHEREPVPDRRH